jgi:hypothetical protein
MPTPIKVIDAPVAPTDGNTKQWDKLKAMRGEHNPPPEPEPVVAAAEPAAEPAKEPARDPDTGKFVAKEPAPETPPVVAKEPAKEPPPPTSPASVEVEIDGQKVQLSPELAEAFKKAEKTKVDTSAASDRERLKAELREELRAELQPPRKSQAELDAEAALAAAEAERNKPKKPDSKLLISDPDEYERQRDTYEEWRVNNAKDEVKRSIQTDAQKRDRDAAQSQEAAARQILTEQFYDAYPVLKDSADLVGPLLEQQFDALLSSGTLNKPLTARQKEDLKKTEFADVAGKATRRLVKLMNSGKTVVPPPPPPPNLAQSQSQPPAKPPTEKTEKPKDKYPTGSMSAALAERRNKMLANG